MSSARRRTSIVQVILNAIVIAFALSCLYPFLLVVAGSVTSESDIVHGGLRLIPQNFSLYAYETLFHNVKRVVNAYTVTIFVTVVGTAISILVTSLLAYPLSRHDLKYRNPILFYVFFTMLFNGGMLPWYIVCVRILHLRENIFALILPYAVVAWYVFLLRNYFQALPNEIAESAKIDGAGEMSILFRIIMPLSKPALAVILLFIGLMYWNDWWLGIMLIDGERLRPLQLMLLSITSGIELLSTNTSSQVRSALGRMIPREGVKFATTLITIGPIILLYPFVQKYFVKGIIMGALKG
jgi:putative aldouronate transport system permease protein